MVLTIDPHSEKGCGVLALALGMVGNIVKPSQSAQEK